MVQFYLRPHAFRYEHKFYFGKNRTHDFRTSRDGGYLLNHSDDERLHRGTHPPSCIAGPTPLPTPRDPPPLHYTAGPTPLPTPRDPPLSLHRGTHPTKTTSRDPPPFLHRRTHPPPYTAGPTPLPPPRDPPPSLHRGTPPPPPPPTPRAAPHQNYD